MAVIFLDIYASGAPNGAVLTTLTDADVSAFEMRAGENELGSGSFTIRRDHASATAANLAAGNYVKVRIPLIQAAAVFGFWLDEHNDTIVASDEEGGEYLVRGGPGTLFILARARLLDEFYVLTQHSRGNYDVPGYWTWKGEPYGAILQRLLEEGRVEPGVPLAALTDDFNRQTDSDGLTWPDVTEELQFPIGVDGLSVYGALVESGELFVRIDPDLDLHAYKTRGTTRTSNSYAAGKVRFVKGENILTEVVRAGNGVGFATHAIVIGKDLSYRQVVSPTYVSGPGRWITVNYPESNDPTLLDKVGLEELSKRQSALDNIELEFLAGDAELTGRYLPFLHFRTGDLVTLHTGTSAWDYTQSSQRVIGYRIVLSEASDDTTDDMRAKSLRWIVEFNNGPGSGRMGHDVSQQNGGSPCSDCPPDPPRDPFVPGSVGPDFIYDICNTVSEVGGTRQAAGPADTELVEGPWYFEVENTQHDVAAFTESLTLRYATPALADIDLLDAIGCATDPGPTPTCQGGTPQGGSLICPYTVLPGGSGTFTIPAGATGFQFLAVSQGYSAPCGAPYVDECWKLSLWRGGGPTSNTPSPGQRTNEGLTGTAAGTDYTLNYPYAPGSLQVWISDSATSPGQLVNPTEVSPSAGTFELGFDATGKTLTVTYQIASTTGTGATNPQPTSTTAAPAASAPTTADYLVGTAQAGLSAEIVVGATPGGELGGTWASPTVDATHAGSTHSAASDTHIADTTDAHDASAISFVPTGTIAATDVQAAIAEVASEAGASGAVGPILISDTPSTPLVFADLIQNEAQDDLLYQDI